MSSARQEVEQISGVAASERHVAVWRSGSRAPDAPLALVAPGFARRMRHMAPVALYLATNGFRVYRCDYLDHIGLSDGDIYEFTMTAMYESQRAVLKAIEAHEGRHPVVVAASLANRTAIRLLAGDERLVGLIGIVGVVDTHKTLTKVFGADWVAMTADEHPDHAEFERKRIRADSWWSDWNAGDWITLERTIAELSAVPQPVVNFCGSDDDWVALADVQRAFEEGDGGPRRLIELPYVEHELSSNPVAGRTVMREVVRLAAELATGEKRDPVDPDFSQIAEQVLFERELEREIEADVAYTPSTRTKEGAT